MNKKSFAIIALTTLGLGLGGGAALAGSHHGDGHGDRMGRGMFKHVDTNQDGVIDEAEAKAAAAKRFERMDKDGDGVITRADFETMAMERFQKADADKDGKVTQDEMKASWGKGMRDKTDAPTPPAAQ